MFMARVFIIIVYCQAGHKKPGQNHARSCYSQGLLLQFMAMQGEPAPIPAQISRTLPATIPSQIIFSHAISWPGFGWLQFMQPEQVRSSPALAIAQPIVSQGQSGLGSPELEPKPDTKPEEPVQNQAFTQPGQNPGQNPAQ